MCRALQTIAFLYSCGTVYSFVALQLLKNYTSRKGLKARKSRPNAKPMPSPEANLRREMARDGGCPFLQVFLRVAWRAPFIPPPLPCDMVVGTDCGGSSFGVGARANCARAHIYIYVSICEYIYMRG